MLRLPVELQTQIFTHVLRSTPLRYGFTTAAASPSPRTSTSLQLTCRAFHSITSSWPAHTLFHFRGTAALIRFLSSITKAQIAQIRHVRVRGFPLPLYRSADRSRFSKYNFTEALKMFPGLQIDTLTVEDPYHERYHGRELDSLCSDMGTYDLLTDLIHSDGWRELRFVSRTTEFLQWPSCERWHVWGTTTGHVERTFKERKRQFQPEGWIRKIEERDGMVSGAGAKLYKAKEACIKDGAEEQTTREEWEANDPIDGKPESDGEGEEASHDGATLQSAPNSIPAQHADRPVMKEVMVVVRRGRGANYVQDGSDLSLELKEMLGKKNWWEIEAQELLLDAEDDPHAYL
ncbi:hypothetical protein MMC13_005305 [Lambiella insularis]|nr:hypothetical protein [Lambiella insularis]